MTEKYYTFTETHNTGGECTIRVSEAQIIEYMIYRGFTDKSTKHLVEEFCRIRQAKEDVTGEAPTKTRYIPQLAKCTRCDHRDENCLDLDFEHMPFIERFRDTVYVHCTGYKDRGVE